MFTRYFGSLSRAFLIILPFLMITFNNCKTQNTYKSKTSTSSNNSNISGSQTANNRYSRVIAYPDTIIIKQPDGKTLTIFLRGDEKIKRAFTSDGYPIIMNPEGFYEYAISDSHGNLLCSGIRANDPGKRNKEEIQYLKKINKK
jgi:hypothetical protein